MELSINSAELHCHAGRALLLARSRMLLVADVHLGKEAAFRAGGLAVPGGVRDDLDRLSDLLARTRARQLVFLGDLVHGRASHQPDLDAGFRAWRAAHADVRMHLVVGNHDLHAGPLPDDWDMESVVEPWPWAEPGAARPFALCHHPQTAPGAYALAGHVHPAARLTGPGGDRLRLPCFWFGAAVGLLPAFGGFTGTAEVRPRPGDRVLVIAGKDVLDVSPADR